MELDVVMIEDPSTVSTVHIIIQGKVQGVWFRAWTEQEALALELDGWVRNRRDGAVEAVFSGNQGSVEVMLEQCYDGPRAAKVDAVEVMEFTGDVEPGFHKLPTA